MDFIRILYGKPTKSCFCVGLSQCIVFLLLYNNILLYVGVSYKLQ